MDDATKPLFDGKPYRIVRHRGSSAEGTHGWASSVQMFATEEEVRSAVAAPMRQGVTDHVAHVAVGVPGDWRWVHIVSRRRKPRTANR